MGICHGSWTESEIKTLLEHGIKFAKTGIFSLGFVQNAAGQDLVYLDNFVVLFHGFCFAFACELPFFEGFSLIIGMLRFSRGYVRNVSWKK